MTYSSSNYALDSLPATAFGTYCFYKVGIQGEEGHECWKCSLVLYDWQQAGPRNKQL